MSIRTRFGTPSSPSGSNGHEGTGVLLATRELPGVGRRHRSTSLYLRKAKPLAKHILPAGACFPRARLFTISPAMQLTLFDAADALRRKLKNTVSLRRSAMPNDGYKRCAHSALMRGLKDPCAYTVIVARQRRVKLTLELSFLRRASRWSAPSAKPRRRVVGEATGTMRTNRYA